MLSLIHILTEDSGKVETNLLPAYIEKGLIREKYNSMVVHSQELSFDVFGNSYVIGDNSDSLFVLDMDAIGVKYFTIYVLVRSFLVFH